MVGWQLPKRAYEGSIPFTRSRLFQRNVRHIGVLIVLDGKLKIVSASRSFYQHFHTEPENAEEVGHQLLGNRQWDIPKLKELLQTILSNNQSLEGFEVAHDFPSIGKRKMLLNARRITGKTGETQLILLEIEIVL